MSPSVYVLEPQELFIPELSRIVVAAGGRVVRSADTIDIEELVSLRVDFALLDLDYTWQGVMDGLAYFRGAAARVNPIVLTDERDFDRLARFRAAGAIAVISKSNTADQMSAALQEIFDVGALRRAI
jgi:DNA-binding NarL/FixJ family response regulator